MQRKKDIIGMETRRPKGRRRNPRIAHWQGGNIDSRRGPGIGDIRENSIDEFPRNLCNTLDGITLRTVI